MKLTEGGDRGQGRGEEWARDQESRKGSDGGTTAEEKGTMYF